MSDLLKVRELTFTYPSGLRVFDRARFSLEKCKVHLLLSHPESGKSTLARVLAALIPRYFGGKILGSVRLFAEQGEISLMDSEPASLVSHVGIVSQNPEEQIIMSECEDELIFPLENMGMDHEQIASRVEQSLERFGLQPYRHTNPANLSGGEKKRLMLAALDAVDPDLWILDETFEELDTDWRNMVASYIRETNKSVLILASRHTEIFDECVDHWGVLESGIITFSSRDHILELFNDVLSEADNRPCRAAYDQPPLCTCSSLAYGYPGSSTEFSLEIESLNIWKDERVALFGPNGSGKTTVSKLLCGLLKPQRGNISIAGCSPCTPEMLNSRAAYLFQNPDFQIFLPTVSEELELGLRLQGKPLSLAAEAAELFELPDKDTPPALMSYGARKRLQAAVVYLLDRSICIVDEMDSGLDLRQFMNIISLLEDSCDALILITHDSKLAEACADRIITIDAGRITGVRRVCR
jgi:energy-coupling factor transport system ATP-binding protein